MLTKRPFVASTDSLAHCLRFYAKAVFAFATERLRLRAAECRKQSAECRVQVAGGGGLCDRATKRHDNLKVAACFVLNSPCRSTKFVETKQQSPSKSGCVNSTTSLKRPPAFALSAYCLLKSRQTMRLIRPLGRHGDLFGGHFALCAAPNWRPLASGASKIIDEET